MSGRLDSINSSRAPGTDVQIGDLRLHITKYTTPCQIISAWFHFTRILQKLHSGCGRVCARVLAGGLIRIGDPVTIA